MQRGQRSAPWKATWKGQLRFGLVSFPVEAVNVRAKEEGDIHFHLLHASCHSRIRFEKVCPVHGNVPNSEIVSAYEYEPGKYVEIESGELDALRPRGERALNVDNFVKPAAIDPIYFDGRTYYLVPAGPEAVEPYQVLCQAMEHQQRWGVGQVTMSGREQLVLIRPHDEVLLMSVLVFPAEIRSAERIDLPRLGKIDAPRPGWPKT